MRIDDPDPPTPERRPTFRTDLRDVPVVAGGLAIALVLMIGLAFFALGRSDNPEREARHPRIVVIPNAEVASLPTVPVPRLVLTGEREIVKGQFLTTEPGAHAPDGFLLEALSRSRITTDAGEPETIVRTRPASLFEAVPAGSLVANPADFRPTSRLIGTEQVEQAGQVERATPEPIEDRVPAAFRSEVGLFGHLNPEFDCTDPTDPGDKAIPRWLRLRPIFKPKLKPVFNMRWNDERWWRKRIETAEAGLRGKLRLGVGWLLRGSLDCTLNPALKLPLFVAAVPAGPVPVPLKVVARVRPTVEAKLATRLKGRVEVLMNGFAGAEYAGERIQAKGTVVPKVKATFPAFEQEMSAGVGVTPAVAIQAGWGGPLGKLAATAELSFPTGVTVRFEPGAGAVPEACIPLRMQGTIRFHLPLKKKPYSAPSPKLTLFKKCRKLGGEENGQRD